MAPAVSDDDFLSDYDTADGEMWESDSDGGWGGGMRRQPLPKGEPDWEDDGYGDFERLRRGWELPPGAEGGGADEMKEEDDDSDDEMGDDGDQGGAYGLDDDDDPVRGRRLWKAPRSAV